MSAKEIRTANEDAMCDVCGRTLLRGESADAYLDGTVRRSVCELCKERALHEGWVREGTVTAFDESRGPRERRRSLLARWRSRRDGAGQGPAASTLRDELDSHAWSELPGSGDGSEPEALPREPRHVHAVPTSVEQKIVSAAQLFNESEHRRTVAGVARSLGAPEVCLLPTASQPSLVFVVVAWELCWYRYEVELSDDTVRSAGQGYELSELSSEERQVNAVTDENGMLEPV